MIKYKYILWRILAMIPTVIIALAFIFMIVRVLPSDPVTFLIDPAHRTPEAIAALTEAMGLDRPLHEQFLIYLLNVFRGDLGFAWFCNRPVAEELIYRFPATLELVLLSLASTTLLAILLGILGGSKRGQKTDNLISVFTLSGIAMPSFWWGLILIFLFYYLVPIFPSPIGRLSAGVSVTRITGLNLLDSLLTGNMVGFADSLSHLVLPVISLSFVSLALLTRIQRTEIVEVLESDYIKTARVKGLSERDVLFKHALKNALLPIITQIGLMFGGLIGGSIVIESVFSWPGMGMFVAAGIQNLDYSSLQGFVIVALLICLVTNLVADLLCAYIDPRIRYGR